MRRSRSLIALFFLAGLGLGAVVRLLNPPEAPRAAAPQPKSEEPSSSPSVELQPALPPFQLPRRATPSVERPSTAVLVGSVADTDGRAVAGAVLRLVGKRGSTATSDAAGRFKLPLGTGDARLVVLVKAAGFVPQRLERNVADEGELQVVLMPGNTIRGRVLDPQAQPLSGATVRIMVGPAGPAPEGDAAAGEDLGTATTELDGRFVLNDLAAGEHLLVVSGRGFARSPGTVVSAPATNVELRLLQGLALEVRVVDEGGRPIAGAWVTSENVEPTGPLIEGTTDADGVLRLQGLPLARGVLGITAAGRSRALVERVRYGGPPVVVTLVAERRLRLLVRGLDGKPVRPSVLVYTPRWEYVWHEVVPVEGGQELAGLGDGPYTLVLDAPDAARIVLKGVNPRQGPISLALEPGLAIKGTLPLPDAGEYVYAVPQGALPAWPTRHPLREWIRPAWVESGAQTFEISGLQERVYDLLIVVGRAEDSRTVPDHAYGGVVVPGVRAGTTDLELKLPQGETIAGTVRREDTSVPSLVEVHAYDERGLCRAYAWPSRETGDFVLRGLPAGRYRVSAWLDDRVVTLEDVRAPTEALEIRAP